MTTDEMKTNFLGIPIDGDISRPTDRKTQRPREEFESIVQALLDDTLIDSFGWRQYTPYFNDGDPCVFGACDLWVKTTTDEPDDDDFDREEYGVEYGEHPTLGKGEGWGADRKYVGEHEASWRRACALSDAVDDGAFDDVLLALFGDHCEIKVTRTGITVDEYSHD